MHREQIRAKCAVRAKNKSVEGFEKYLLAAQGYCELGMHDEAIAELDAMPAEAHREPTAVEMRLMVLVHARRWKAALPLAREMCALRPDAGVGYIHGAFCLHELGRTKEAKELLLKGPPEIEKEPTFHYNLACYECALGQLEEARRHLDRSFAMDKKFRAYAKIDPDLKALQI